LVGGAIGAHPEQVMGHVVAAAAAGAAAGAARLNAVMAVGGHDVLLRQLLPVLEWWHRALEHCGDMQCAARDGQLAGSR
jgi:3-hydroxyisobutyrate dehydrogenase-like beta-hydroxyacid dehydrogenase